MSIQSFSKSFVENILPVNCGIPESALSGISSKYVVTIRAKFGKQMIASKSEWAGGEAGKTEFTVFGFLQEKVVLTAGSDWKGITQLIPDEWQKGLNAINTGAQVAGRSFISTISTRRVWSGSHPIGIRMKLKFEAYKDVKREVIMPCMALQGLTLPRGGGGGAVSNTVFFIPPGPNPFNWSTEGQEDMERAENIELSIGGFLTFPSVIIKDVNVTFENRMSISGPIGAEVDLTIETYQMPTRENLMKFVGSDLASISMGQTLGQGINNSKPG